MKVGSAVLHFFVLIIKGYVMGMANLIPGVSGGTLAMTLGIYNDFIFALSHFFSHFKKIIAFLVPVVIGIILSFLTLSGVIKLCFEFFPLPVTLFFMGLVAGGIPMLLKHVKGKKTESKKLVNWIVFALGFIAVIALAIVKVVINDTDNGAVLTEFWQYAALPPLGALIAAAMIIPGISGSLLLMLFGFYYPVIGSLHNIAKLDNLGGSLLIVGLYGAGIIAGLILFSKVIEMLFKKHETTSYYGVLGFIFASVIAIPISTAANGLSAFSPIHIPVAAALFVVGCVGSYFLARLK